MYLYIVSILFSEHVMVLVATCQSDSTALFLCINIWNWFSLWSVETIVSLSAKNLKANCGLQSLSTVPCNANLLALKINLTFEECLKCRGTRSSSRNPTSLKTVLTIVSGQMKFTETHWPLENQRDKDDILLACSTLDVALNQSTGNLLCCQLSIQTTCLSAFVESYNLKSFLWSPW